MKIESVFDAAFAAYGRVITGYEAECAAIVKALETTPLPEGVGYVPVEEVLQKLPEAAALGVSLYGGMDVEFGWCNGHNAKLNCFEYHRDSEFNLGTEDFVLLLAKQDEIVDGKIDSSCVRAFRCPANVLIEVYATTLHYAPCHADPAKGFRVMIALPMGTNFDKPELPVRGGDDKMLWARNKWLLAHPETSEAAQGAHIGIVGENIDISCDL